MMCMDERKRTTVWNKVHCCKFCKEVDVMEVLQMSKRLGARNKLVIASFDILRNEGDHIRNKKTLKKGEGEMILGRRHKKHTSKVDEYGSCLGCHVWIKLDRTLRLHQKVCPAVILAISEQICGKEIRILSLCAAGRINEEASRGFKKKRKSLIS